MSSRNPHTEGGADRKGHQHAQSDGRRKSNPSTAPLLRLLRLVFRAGGRIAPRLTGRLACRLWYRTTRFPLPAAETRALQDASIKIQQIGRRRIATCSWGTNGAQVLLIHGWNGRATQLAPIARSLLKTGYRVLGFDAPAHGESTGEETSIYEIADVIVELDRRHGPFHAVITHSFGGPSLALAMKRGFSAERVVCLCPPANATGLVEKFARTLHISEKTVQAMKRLIEARFGTDVWSEVSMVNNVQAQTTPAMIIHDENDRDVPWQEGYAVSQAWPGCRFLKTSQLGHHRILKDKTTIQTVIAFIDEDLRKSSNDRAQP
jgi:pimeloyl-ACP methyl ester carboxylesterase